MPRPTRDDEFATFVQNHRTSLLKFACLLTAGDGHQAEDLVQTALTKVYLAWPKLRRSEGELAYARRTLLNSHIDETRRPRWRRERSTPVLPEVAAYEGPDGILGLEHGRFGPDGQRVRVALATLPARMRAVVILRYWLDLSVEDSARMLGCTQGTVKSQAAKGTAKLRDLLTAPSLPTVPGYQTGR
ncbi:SigE family RNA polymerase sigma factor [Kineosporia mesophila]|uniref:SigE family RNA polymerase sigma factor n=1 Tax=Kineosporia mesophila TaxID=566012 RepID=A0ABP6Z383_9ACTN|nr:SigE family RNA polymerase sigma factor [Kineosporia mesophila]MCD5355195.1 SigE family RNA polymerase sigma factor [Kineosporia mesophila]